jgi:glycerol-3-phosphate cytidylyltransferase
MIMQKKKYKVGYTTGVYDMFHIGHLNIIKRAKEQCEFLIVGVTTDKLCMSRKNKRPIICESDRVAIVESIKYVDKVVPQADMDKLAAVKKYGADAVFVGSDWKGTESWNRYEKEFAAVGCTVVYLDHTDGISSTILRDRLNELHSDKN